MWEASLYGVTDVNKISLETRTTKSGGPRAQIWDAAGHNYDLYVDNGYISGINSVTRQRISGESLVGATLHVLQSGQPLYHIRIDRVRTIPTPVGAPDPIEVYKMVWVPQQASLGEGELCEVPEQPFDNIKDADQLYGMLRDETLVFPGDRINQATLTISDNAHWDPSWFNFGCAGRTLAKMRLLRKTLGNSVGTPDWSARQAALKMLSADYCGIGAPFTHTGQRIRWKDDQGLVDSLQLVNPDGTVNNRRLEARWTELGISCMDAARLQYEHPAVWDYIHQTCLPMSCYDPISTPGVGDLAGAKIVSAIF
jgi:hypothetical protein